MPNPFTPEQLAAYRRFRKVRESSAYNMMDPRVQQVANITRDEQLFCIINCRELWEATKNEEQE